MKFNDLIVVRGGGDLATGVVQKLHRAGFNVLILEAKEPTAIRRNISLCEAVYHGMSKVEDITCQKIDRLDQREECWNSGVVPLIIDPDAQSIAELKPDGVVDAIIAKRNIGTNRDMAEVTIGIGPGFWAGKDVEGVVESMRGHNLGRLILKGSALANTGIPGEVGGKSAQRVVHAPIAGKIKGKTKIGDIVTKGQCLLTVDNTQVCAPFTGLLRGLIRDDLAVFKGMKVADVDPRIDTDWKTISDKARCLGGAVLEAYMYLKR